MTVSELLTALAETTRVDLTVGSGDSAKTYRIESNELDILDSTTKALTIATITLASDGRTPFILATTAA